MKLNYLNVNNWYIEARKRYDELIKVSQDIKKRLTKYPKGKLYISNKKGNVQYYLRMDPKEKRGSYISKKEDKKIKLYLQKKYDEEIIQIIDQEIKSLERILNIYSSNLSLFQNEKSIQNQYSNNPKEIKEKIIPVDVTDEDFAHEWLEQPFERKMIGGEAPEYITTNGEKVRSKSELNIANALAKNNIPYKYECPLKLSGGVIIHPDFTVLNLRKRKEIYWEHRGMMDDENYSRKSVSRIKSYERDGIFLGDKLVITEETLNCPLGTGEIDRIIKHYFL